MFFVYVDRTGDGRPFYVGKGNARRARSRERNTKHAWISEQLGRTRTIELETEREQEALDYEIGLIAKYDTFTTEYALRTNDIRCNFTRGGEGLTGHKDTPETREKKRQNAFLQGQDQVLQQRKRQALLGRTFSDESKRLMGAASSRSVRQITLDGAFVAEYPSIRVAVQQVSKAIGKRSIDIAGCCNGSRKTAGGFRWEYAGERGKKQL